MSHITLRPVKTLIALLITMLALVVPVTSASAQNACGDTSGFTKRNLSSLPAQATDTVNLIKKGGPYPYPQDNKTFQNREGILPSCSLGYYKEYTVKTPGSSTRGARRIVTGNASPKLYFYTPDHYASFVLVDITR